ncbi:MAG: FHA domain-containing protein [Planctomycetes bacterium]|nr:FHA domain-containing protein [Planctomycetota bacterium]
MPRLVIFDNQVRGVDLPPQPVIIGRSKKSDIPIRDELLSRKHCAIVPTGAQYRLVDLKSANGTFLNGARVKGRADLNYDDLIEIGQTVMVFLDAGVWNRGEGLARLRNPIKAQELIQRLKLQEQPGKGKIPLNPMARSRSREARARNLLALFKELPVAADAAAVLKDGFLELLTDYAAYKTVSFLIRHHPQLRRALSRTVEGAVLSSVHGQWDGWRARLRADLEEQIKSAFTASPEAKGKSAKRPPGSSSSRPVP